MKHFSDNLFLRSKTTGILHEEFLKIIILLLIVLIDFSFKLLLVPGSDHIVNGIIAPPWALLLALDSNASVLEDTLQLWIDVDERMHGLPQQLEEELVSKAAYNTQQVSKLPDQPDVQ